MLLAAIFLAWQSVNFLAGLTRPAILHPLVTFGLAWVLNMLITGVFAFTGFALPTQRLLPESYYRISRPDRLKTICRNLGIQGFRKFLLATFWRKRSKRKQFFPGGRKGLEDLAENTKNAEFGHLMAFIFLNLAVVFLFWKGFASMAAFTLAWNILGNAYPILLQRHTRLRISRIFPALIHEK